jgi:hypothetical protein
MKMDIKVPIILLISVLFLGIFFFKGDPTAAPITPQTTPLPTIIERPNTPPVRTDVKVRDYNNTAYGFKFSYPDTFELTEKNVAPNGACGSVLQISLINPRTPLLYYDLNIVGYSDPVHPHIELTIQKANCGKQDSPQFVLRKDLYASFISEGIAQNVALATLLSAPGVEEKALDNATGKMNSLWKDFCDPGLLLHTTSGAIYVKNKNCLMGGGLDVQVQTLIPFKSQNFFVNIRAQKIFYEDNGYMNLIENSFSFTK